MPKKKTKKTGKRAPSKRAQLTPVLVTNIHRGVYFGWTTDKSARPIVLHRFRHCVYLEQTQGNYSAAVDGPGGRSKIGPECIEVEVGDVANVVVCTAEAAAKFSSAGWG